MHCKPDSLIYSCLFLLAKVRRLYDIANVLTSLGLIKKVHVTEERGRKPAFKWIGPVEFPEKTGNLCSLHLYSLCFDGPFLSGKRLLSVCKELLPAQHLLLLDLAPNIWICEGKLKDTLSCMYFYTDLDNCMPNCTNCEAIAESTDIFRCGPTAVLGCKTLVIP